jgi:hypothetical protein
MEYQFVLQQGIFSCSLAAPFAFLPCPNKIKKKNTHTHFFATSILFVVILALSAVVNSSCEWWDY